MLRSPSHESVTTDLSLFSVSSLASAKATTSTRPPSSTLHSTELLLPPDAARRRQQSRRAPPPAVIPELLWFEEEETELMRGCAALSTALGLQKSFSTGDICAGQWEEEWWGGGREEEGVPGGAKGAVSEEALLGCGAHLLQLQGGGCGSAVFRCPLHRRLDAASRSCSTWVAVGDAVSQLPSPHGGAPTDAPERRPPPPPPPPSSPPFAPADLIRSVNKKVRQGYIRRRLVATFRALERLSRGEFAAQKANEESHPSSPSSSCLLRVPGSGGNSRRVSAAPAPGARNLPLTIRDVERERGKPLSKYERNMMIFDWLHTLDDASFEGLQ
ncbi:hypothetical protein J437_LFUL014084 [Ladona fulva]|uniref:Uncharacterized protein n=1 Tax=Ladona fulva TaxID=123851 RepID=A0A8K0KR74_LADFU|nr:hypothetical protein J437_LFUL014084 [Ladona fulva]